MSSIERYKDEQAREWEDQFQEREQTLDEPLTCCRWAEMAVGRGLIYPFIKRLLNWWATGKELHPWFGVLGMLMVNRLREELQNWSIAPIDVSFQTITATLVLRSIRLIIWIRVGEGMLQFKKRKSFNISSGTLLFSLHTVYFFIFFGQKLLLSTVNDFLLCKMFYFVSRCFHLSVFGLLILSVEFKISL